jgi:hypothetical protein
MDAERLMNDARQLGVADPKIRPQPGSRQWPSAVCTVGFRRGAPTGGMGG